MFAQYEPNVRATISFLKQLKVKVNNSTVNETLQNHPDWPSLLCVSDSLNKWNITNGAGKIDTADIDQFPTPFIAHIRNRENPLAIVTKVSDTTVHAYSGNYNKPKIQKREDFLNQWNGVYLIAETTSHSGEAQYELKRRKQIFHSLIPLTAFFVFIFLTSLFLYRIVNADYRFLFF